jgi:tetratricopeptide (TPR) repeat protein
MAAPAVAGAAAFVRARRPDLAAAEVKKLIQYSAKSVSSLTGKIATGGVLDETTLFKITGSPAERAAVWAAASMAAAYANQEAFPERMADADQFSRLAVEIAPQSSEAWCARAIYFDRIGVVADAIQAIDRAVAVSPDSWRSWTTRAQIYSSQNNHEESLASWSKAVAASTGDRSASALIRAQLLIGRAKEYQAAGLSPLAILDLRAARQLDPKASNASPLLGLLR